MNEANNINDPLEALLRKHAIMLNQEALTSIERLDKKSLFYIERGLVAVRCGKIYRKDQYGVVWMKSSNENLSKLLAFLYSINLIQCRKDNVVVFTKEYRSMMQVFNRCETNTNS